MKWMLVVSVFLVNFSFAQQWKDSLLNANKAYQSGNYSRAFDKFLSAQRLAPDGVDLSKDIGVAAYRSGDYETAARAFETAAEKSLTSEEAAKKWHNIGNSQLKQENYSVAVESYKKALRLTPQNEQTRYNLAQAQRRLMVEQQEQQDNQQQNKDQQDDSPAQQNQQDASSNQDKQGNQNEQQNQDQQPQDGQQEEQEDPVQKQFSDKRTEKLLDELLKKEMETKKKMQGRNREGKIEHVESGKRW